MAFYSLQDNKSISNLLEEEENSFSEINYLNQQPTQSGTNKINQYKTDSESQEQETIEEFIKKEFIDNMNKKIKKKKVKMVLQK